MVDSHLHPEHRQKLVKNPRADVVKATPDSIDAEERMIPWHKDVVQRVDLEAGRIYVNWGVDY